MLIIGETLNTSRVSSCIRHVEAAVIARDEQIIAQLAIAQRDYGATYIDINAGTLTHGEAEALEWMTVVAQQATSLPISFDSPNPAALSAALAVYDRRYGPPIINSISAESKRYAAILPLVQRYSARIIALAMDDQGIQPSSSARLAVATALVERLHTDGIPYEDIYLDPLVFPIATDDDVVMTTLDIIPHIMAAFPGVHTIAGISNVSHGLPARVVLNRAFTILAMGRGLDACIVDTQDRQLMSLLRAAETLLGRDESCLSFLTRAREGAFVGL